MAKVTLRLPSKKVQYGYVEIETSSDELGIEATDSHALGQYYVDSIVAFQRSEIGAVQAASKEAEAPTGDPATLVREELGGREIGSKDNKPWEQATPAPKTNTKPWESPSSSSDDDWDI